MKKTNLTLSPMKWIGVLLLSSMLWVACGSEESSEADPTPAEEVSPAPSTMESTEGTDTMPPIDTTADSRGENRRAG